VLYRLRGKQTSTSFEDPQSAVKFKEFWQTGSARQSAGGHRLGSDLSTMTLEKWLEDHIAHLTGLRLA
jgi:hypothetical protein